MRHPDDGITGRRHKRHTGLDKRLCQGLTLRVPSETMSLIVDGWSCTISISVGFRRLRFSSFSSSVSLLASWKPCSYRRLI